MARVRTPVGLGLRVGMSGMISARTVIVVVRQSTYSSIETHDRSDGSQSTKKNGKRQKARRPLKSFVSMGGSVFCKGVLGRLSGMDPNLLAL